MIDEMVKGFKEAGKWIIVATLIKATVVGLTVMAGQVMDQTKKS